MKLNINMTGEPGKWAFAINDEPVHVYALDICARPHDETKITMQVYGADMELMDMKFIGCSEHDHELLKIVRAIPQDVLNAMPALTAISDLVQFLREERTF